MPSPCALLGRTRCNSPYLFPAECRGRSGGTKFGLRGHARACADTLGCAARSRLLGLGPRGLDCQTVVRSCVFQQVPLPWSSSRRSFNSFGQVAFCFEPLLIQPYSRFLCTYLSEGVERSGVSGTKFWFAVQVGYMHVVNFTTCT